MVSRGDMIGWCIMVKMAQCIVEVVVMCGGGSWVWVVMILDGGGD